MNWGTVCTTADNGRSAVIDWCHLQHSCVGSQVGGWGKQEYLQ